MYCGPSADSHCARQPHSQTCVVFHSCVQYMLLCHFRTFFRLFQMMWILIHPLSCLPSMSSLHPNIYQLFVKCIVGVTGLPGRLSGKESTCQYRRRGLDPWVGKIPRKRERQPTPVFLPGESHGQSYRAWGHKESGHNLATKQQ